MNYLITFTDNQKTRIIDDVARFVLSGNETLVIFEDNSKETLTNVLGLSAYFYNEGY